MNRALPPGDRGPRNADSLGPFGSARAVLGAIGLVGRVAHRPERKTPPGGCPAARTEPKCAGSGFDGVGTLAVLALGRGDGHPHLLADRARQKPANGMWLPVCGFHQLFGGDAARSLEQFEHLGGLATVAGPGGFLRALGAFLPGLAFLADLPFFGATWAPRGATRAVLVAFVCSLRTGPCAVAVSAINSVILISPLAVDYRHDMDHSGERGKQANSQRNRTKAMERRFFRINPDGRR
jgi:hypothetical protein